MNDEADTEGRVFNLTETQYATRLGMSVSFLQKDRMREQPEHEFRRYGRSVRYPDTAA